MEKSGLLFPFLKEKYDIMSEYSFIYRDESGINFIRGDESESHRSPSYRRRPEQQ